MAILARIALDVVAELEDGAHFGAGEIGDGAEIFAGHARGGGENIGIFLHGNRGLPAVPVVALLAMVRVLLRHESAAGDCADDAACSVKISSSAAMAVSTWARSRM